MLFWEFVRELWNKVGPASDDLADVEFQQLFESITSSSEYENLVSKVNEIELLIDTYTQSAEIEELSNKVNDLENTIDHMDSYIIELENNLKRYAMALSWLEVSN